MSVTITRQEVIALIDTLPTETLPELAQFAEFLRSKTFPHNAPMIDVDEQRLLTIIQRRLAPEQQHRLDQLRRKNEIEELLPSERAELLQITEQIEYADAERAGALIELARLRNKPVATILREYSPEYVTDAN
ncbi:MAG: hypothetical protein FJ009_16810 [Chloroflexi bacterium]|nr:hypothetical protein [Chloroflexota bacterium]